MNILILTFQGDIAGSTYSISYLAKGLAERGHQVYVGCRKESLLYKLLDQTKAHLLPMTFSGRFDLANMGQIRDAVKKHNIQLINAQSSFDRYTSVLAKWRYRLPVKVVHTRRQVSKSVGGLFQNLIYVKGTDRIAAVSEGVKVSLTKGGVPDNHISVIYNGTPKEKYEQLDKSFTEQLRGQFGISSEDFVIGCISRLKNQAQILEALTYLPFKAKAIFVGIDKQTEWEEIIESYRQGHEVFFTGLIEVDKVLNYFPLFDVKILASTMEGLSQSLLEAMALGVPVIATKAAGNPELIDDGVNGFLFDDGDTRELANQIKIVKENNDLRDKFIRMGKETALKKFNIRNTVDNFELLFQSLINN